MKYIWTFWTKPMVAQKTLLQNLTYLSLSIEYVKRFSSDFVVYTDSLGAEYISNVIDVDTHIVLNKFDTLDINKWALPKIYSNHLQKTPFCQIDYDVLLRKEPPINNYDLTVQCIENKSYAYYYNNSYLDFIQDGNKTPSEMKVHVRNNRLMGYNVGYLQINNIDFSNKWIEQAYKIYENMRTFDHNNNIFPEQCLLFCMSELYNIKVYPLLGYEEHKWHDVSVALDYRHIMWQKAKWLPNALQELSQLNPKTFSLIQNYFRIDSTISDISNISGVLNGKS